MKKHDLIHLIYHRSDPYLYGAIITVPDIVSKKKVSSPFLISKMLGGKEIVFGSVSNTLFKIDALIDRFMEHQDKATNSLSERNIKPLKEGVLPKSEGVDLFLHEQAERVEEAIFLISIYLRPLLEVFGDRIDENLQIYTYEENRSSDQISLKDFIGLLMHQRYFVVNGEYVVGAVSDRKQLPSSGILGSKVHIFEFFNAVKKIISENIKLNSFLNMLQSKLDNPSAHSNPQNIVFLVQNVHSLANIVESRVVDERFNEVADILLAEPTKKFLQKLGKDKPRVREVNVRHIFGRPQFKIAPDQSKKKIQIHTNINGQDEEVEIEHTDFFAVMKRNFGNDPLISFRT